MKKTMIDLLQELIDLAKELIELKREELQKEENYMPDYRKLRK